MAKIKGYKDLIAWQKAMDLVEEVQRILKGLVNSLQSSKKTNVRI